MSDEPKFTKAQLRLLHQAVREGAPVADFPPSAALEMLQRGLVEIDATVLRATKAGHETARELGEL